MKKMIIVILLLAPSLNTSAQKAVKVTDMPLTMAMGDIAKVLDNRQVKVVGIGNITNLAKESTDLNMAIATWLISQKKFRHIVLFEGWLVRPLNEYLTDKRPFDSTTVDSLVRMSMTNSGSRTASISSFMIWLKKYNLSHPKAPVSVSGLMPDDIITPAYFLATYILPVDPVKGRTLSKRWGENIYDLESPFKDIAAWYQQISKNVVLFNRHKALLLDCAEDLEHNDVIRRSILVEERLRMAMEVKMQAMAKLIVAKSNKRTIIYADNEQIVKANYFYNGDTVMSLGLLLHEQLKDKYYACLTDFADSSSLHLIDPETGQLKLTTIPGSVQTLELSRKKSVFFMPEDSADMLHYQPRTIYPAIGVDRVIVPDNTIPATDAVFIIKHLTSIKVLQRIYMDPVVQ
jgi:erythromycin esterase-like protein